MAHSPLDELCNVSIGGLFRMACAKRSEALQSQSLHYRMTHIRFTRRIHRIFTRHREYVLERRRQLAMESGEVAAEGTQEGTSGDPAPKRQRTAPTAAVNAPSTSTSSAAVLSTSSVPSTSSSSTGASSSTTVSAPEPRRPFRIPNILRRSRAFRAAPVKV